LPVLDPQSLTEKNHSRKIDIVQSSFIRRGAVRELAGGALTAGTAFGCIDAVRWLGLLLLIVLECSCTTLANRRDLYSPEPSPTSIEFRKQWRGTTTTTTTTHVGSEELTQPPAKPDFRY
jgi:hypothetical protein